MRFVASSSKGWRESVHELLQTSSKEHDGQVDCVLSEDICELRWHDNVENGCIRIELCVAEVDAFIICCNVKIVNT